MKRKMPFEDIKPKKKQCLPEELEWLKHWSSKPTYEELQDYSKTFEKYDVGLRKVMEAFTKYGLLNYLELVKDEVVHIRKDKEKKILAPVTIRQGLDDNTNKWLI